MRIRVLGLCAFILAGPLVCGLPTFAQGRKDYITNTEADKIRDANDSNERIKLFLSFASNRLKQLQYELDHPADTVRRSERLNSLLNAYAGCMDEAVDRMELGAEKQEDVRDGIKAVQDQAPEHLKYLKDVVAKNPEHDTYKDNLDDAIASTQDAIRSAADSLKEDAPPPPMRRRPQ
jgi:hypothetical protein